MPTSALETFRIYSYGQVRLPASFVAEHVVVTWDKVGLRFRPAHFGEVSLKPVRSRRAVSSILNLVRVFKAMGKSSVDLAGVYEIEMVDEYLVVRLEKRRYR